MSGLNDLFDQVVVVNLDRRPDRMATVAAQLDALGTRYRRFAAIDGRDPVVASSWRSYAAQPMLKTPAVGAVASYREFYLADRSPAARVAFFEQTKGTKAIATAGAWGLLASMTGVIEMALAEGWPSLLILEDDVLFHRDTLARLVALRNSRPANWAVMQLGALQRHWEEGWIAWQGADLYRCNGTSFGAHAVGLRREVLPDLLALAHRRDLPFDVGALQEVKRNYRERCFTCYPNLVIQDPSDSEIGMSQLSAAETMKAGNVYRWHYPDYGIAVIKGTGGRAMAGAARSRLAAMGRALSAAVRPAPPAAPPTPAPPKVASAPQRPRFNMARLGPLANGDKSQGTVLALLIGAEPAQYDSAVALLTRQMRGGKVMPVAVTDREDFTALRAGLLPFEYLPAANRRTGAFADLPWDLYRLRRLAILRRKYQPLRIVAFGPEAQALLEAWRVSPFEADFPGPDLGNERSGLGNRELA